MVDMQTEGVAAHEQLSGGTEALLGQKQQDTRQSAITA